MALFCPLAAGAQTPAVNEFAERRADADGVSPMVQVFYGRHEGGNISFNRFGVGVRLGGGYVLTGSDVAGLVGDGSAQVLFIRDPETKATADAEIVRQDTFAGLVLLKAAGLEGAAVTLAPVAPEAEETKTGGFSFSFNDNAVSFDAPLLRDGLVRTSLMGDLAVGPGEGRRFRGGPILDLCMRLGGMMDEVADNTSMRTGHASRGAYFVGLSSITAFLKAAGVEPTVSPGQCMPASAQAEIEAARTSADTADASARKAAEERRKKERAAVVRGELMKSVPGVLMAGVAVLVALRLLRADVSLTPPLRRRRQGWALVTAGFVTLGAALARDPLAAVLAGPPPPKPLALTCTLDAAGDDARTLAVTVDPRTGCVTQGEEEAPFVPLGSRFERVLRPKSAFSASGEWDGAISIRTIDLESGGLVETRYRLPAAVRAPADAVWRQGQAKSCADPNAVKDLEARRRFTAPYLAKSEQISRTVYKCAPS